MSLEHAKRFLRSGECPPATLLSGRNLSAEIEDHIMSCEDCGRERSVLLLFQEGKEQSPSLMFPEPIQGPIQEIAQGPIQEPRRRAIRRRSTPTINRYEVKRMAEFAKRQIADSDVRHATAHFVDKVPYGQDNCTLCGARLAKRYRLYFRKPPKEEQTYHRINAVDFFPVGSICITNWAESLPPSEDRRVILEGIDAQKDKARRWKEPVVPPPEPEEPKEMSPELQALFDTDLTDDDWSDDDW